MVQKVVMGTRLPAKLWLDDVEDSCMAQIISLASLPFAFKHIAIMPDAHTGKGMPIGGVLATIGVVIPNAVGVDIGCGMCAVKTNLKALELSVNQIKAIMRHIRKTIPLGFDHQKNAMDKSLLPDLDLDACPFLRNKTVAMLKEIGTLGGGNHFIEIQKDTKKDDVWIMIHSGSRHVGLTVANYYNKQAEILCERWYADTLPGLAFLPIEEQVGKDYMHEMEFFFSSIRNFAYEDLLMRRGTDSKKNGYYQAVCLPCGFPFLFRRSHHILPIDQSYLIYT